MQRTHPARLLAMRPILHVCIDSMDDPLKDRLCSGAFFSKQRPHAARSATIMSKRDGGSLVNVPSNHGHKGFPMTDEADKRGQLIRQLEDALLRMGRLVI
jgi:hypothetical protein